jgi:P27 family predicted phage terminase small subunit
VSHRPVPARIEFTDTLTDVELTPPANLGEAGLRAWEQSVVPLARMGAIRLGDLPTARIMCEAADERARASAIVEREGMMVTSTKGTLMAHPAIRVAQAASARFLRCAVELGCTPASRTRLGVNQVRGMTLAEELEQRLGPVTRRR